MPELRAWPGQPPPTGSWWPCIRRLTTRRRTSLGGHARSGIAPLSAPTIAVLVRKRMQIERIVDALRAAGLPVEVVGVGGLLTTPRWPTCVATLRVLADPTRGDALMRLLTGARWRIGPRDLDALGRWARRLARLRRGETADRSGFQR